MEVGHSEKRSKLLNIILESDEVGGTELETPKRLGGQPDRLSSRSHRNVNPSPLRQAAHDVVSSHNYLTKSSVRNPFEMKIEDNAMEGT